MKKFYIQTLGCKVNQYESDGIALSLEKQGWIKGKKEQSADVFIINTCAVTSKASMQSRQAIRKIIRQNPDAKVIVTGCHAQTDPDQIKKIDHIDHADQIVCHKDKFLIADHIASVCENKSLPIFKKPDHSKTNKFQSFDSTVKGNMTRAYLKIQDGCNAFCTYCIVPHARGSSVSMPQKEVFKQLRQLNNSGFKEVIITGIHTGMYGLDFKKRTDLAMIPIIIAFVINIILNFIFIPIYGTIAAAYTTLFAFIVMSSLAFLIKKIVYKKLIGDSYEWNNKKNIQ